MKITRQSGHTPLLTDSTWDDVDLSGIARQLLAHFAYDSVENISLAATDTPSGYNAATSAR